MIFQSDTFILDQIDNCIIFVHSKSPPTDVEYSQILSLYSRLGSQLATSRTLVLTDGAGPSIQQRKEQSRQFGDALKSVKTAVVSDAITIRFVVSSVALFIKTIRAFEKKDFADALRFLEFTPDQEQTLKSRLSEVPAGRFKTLDACLGRT